MYLNCSSSCFDQQYLDYGFIFSTEERICSLSCTSSHFYITENGYQCTVSLNCPSDMPFKIRVDSQI